MKNHRFHGFRFFRGPESDSYSESESEELSELEDELEDDDDEELLSYYFDFSAFSSLLANLSSLSFNKSTSTTKLFYCNYFS